MTAAGASRVSVIVPVYDRERYVRECLESILSTGYPNLEILVVDDGSTDGTPAILADMERQNPGAVRVLHNPGRTNRGSRVSTNLALGVATGRYVCFLDSDDLMLPHRFATAVPLLDADPSLDGVVEITEIVFADDAAQAEWDDRALRYGPQVPSIRPDRLLAACLLERSCSMHTENLLVRRELFARSGVYRPTRGRSEDFHLFLRMAACGRFAVGERDRPVTLYRRHGGNIWRPDSRDSLRDVGVLGDVLAWARRSEDVLPGAVGTIDQAYRRKARWCLTMLRDAGERVALARFATRLAAADPRWVLDRGFVGNVAFGLLGRSQGSSPDPVEPR